VLLNQVTALENEKNSLGSELLGLRNSIYANNETIRKQNVLVMEGNVPSLLIDPSRIENHFGDTPTYGTVVKAFEVKR
jgi:hypothetical protein